MTPEALRLRAFLAEAELAADESRRLAVRIASSATAAAAVARTLRENLDAGCSPTHALFVAEHNAAKAALALVSSLEAVAERWRAHVSLAEKLVELLGPESPRVQPMPKGVPQ